MIGIDQQLDGDIIDGLYAANAPSALNPVATIADITAGSGGGEILWTADVTDTRIVAAAGFSNVVSIPYPVNPLVIDGKTRKVRYVCNYSKTSPGASSINFQFVIGGITLTFLAFTPSAGVIANRTFVFEVTMNFRAGNQAQAMIQLFNNTVNGDINEQTQRTLVLGTWNKTIANTIDFQWQVVTVGSHTLIVQQVEGELL